MSQLSQFLRKTTTGHLHWCPGCKEVHNIPDSWTFNGDLNCPNFDPSVRITGKQIEKDERGEWTGEWIKGPDGKALDYCCHYFLHNGKLEYCGDCTHDLRNQTVPLPQLPDWLKDEP